MSPIAWYPFMMLFSLLLLRCSCDGDATEDGEETQDMAQEEAADGPEDPAVEDVPQDPPQDPAPEDPVGEDSVEEDVSVEDIVEEAEIPEPSCFDPAPPGEYKTSVGCFDIFTFCSAQPSDHLLVKNGVNSELTSDDLRALKDSVEDAVMHLPYVNMFGIGITCCDGTTNAGCLCIHLMGNSGVTIEQMAERLSAIEPFCSEPSCFGVAVTIPVTTGPRCEPADPDCLPVPMCDPENCPGGSRPDPGCCPECPPYDSGAERIVAIGDHPEALVSSDLEGLEAPLMEEDGECAHDGECVLNGCGQYCSSYDDLRFISTCECYPGLSPAYCGCVGGRCRWFYQ